MYGGDSRSEFAWGQGTKWVDREGAQGNLGVMEIFNI